MSVSKVSLSTRKPDASKFTKDELKRIDIDGLERNYLTITWSKLSDDEYFAMRDIAANQYKLPIRYLKPVPNSFSYIAQKSQLSGKEKDIKNAGIVVEPLNADFFNMISYTPINQSLPLGTMITIDVENPFLTTDGTEPERKFIWSNNLRTDPDVESKIKQENPKSIRTKPWIRCCHYGAVDIGSRLTAKYECSYVDTEIIRSFSLFGFSRSDERKEFTIWVYKCFNVQPVQILELIKKQPNLEASTPKVLDAVLAKCK